MTLRQSLSRTESNQEKLHIILKPCWGSNSLPTQAESDRFWSNSTSLDVWCKHLLDFHINIWFCFTLLWWNRNRNFCLLKVTTWHGGVNERKRAVGIGQKCKGWGQLTATNVAHLGETLANQRNWCWSFVREKHKMWWGRKSVTGEKERKLMSKTE
jgi:hypothetical protein